DFFGASPEVWQVHHMLRPTASPEVLKTGRLSRAMRTSLIVVGLFFFSSAGARADTLIDSFSSSTGSTGVSATGGLNTLTANGVNLIGAPQGAFSTADFGGGILGGSRQGSFTLTGTGPSSQLTAFVAGGKVAFSTNATATGIFALSWGPGLGANFSAE